MQLQFDVYSGSLNKYGEQHCGDVVDILQRDGSVSILLADGLGSGFTASLHAGLHAKLIMSLVSRGEDLKSIVDTVAAGMEKNNSRGLDYCAFTLLSVRIDGTLTAAVYNTPEPVILRRDKPLCLDYKTVHIGTRQVKTLDFVLKPADTVALFSDGVIKAGIGGSLNLGLGEKSVQSYISAAYKPHITAQKLVNLLLSVCNSLYLNRPGDDVSAVVLRALNFQ